MRSRIQAIGVSGHKQWRGFDICVMDRISAILPLSLRSGERTGAERSKGDRVRGMLVVLWKAPHPTIYSFALLVVGTGRPALPSLRGEG